MWVGGRRSHLQSLCTRGKGEKEVKRKHLVVLGSAGLYHKETLVSLESLGGGGELILEPGRQASLKR